MMLPKIQNNQPPMDIQKPQQQPTASTTDTEPSLQDSCGDDHDSTIPKISEQVQRNLGKLPKRCFIQPDQVDLSKKMRLGCGAFCEVHKVVTTKDQQTLAMKHLSPKAMHHQSPRHISGCATDLSREAALLATINHENIINLHGISAGSMIEDGIVVVDDEKKGFFILLDRLKTTLDRKIIKWRKEENASMPPSWRIRKHNQHRRKLLWERLEVALEIVKGLQYLHDVHRIVHCDIKPDSIGFDENGVVKIFDFGLAMKLNSDTDAIRGFGGTRLYMAPEIHQHEPYGRKVDVFAFAMTLWQMCALEDIPVYVHGCDDRPQMQGWWPKELRELMAQCWSADPDDRPSCKEIVSRIENMLSERRGEQ
eukprot:CAMPEP_0116840680 /NCGR_PEP_ID=MMETSP0418-20121206/10498_1 /TAXON_ID=1158023 /ORGANISM="Astrosyne radiata, Strain 13vi08-1A" /LENGTH=365 /DNA_ID=CAMNT_0004471011 /DNA_START=37 /DNA_END=1134 /DNA_ORIENTATION=+